MRCKHALWASDHDHCTLMDVPCTGSYPGLIFGPDEMDCYEPLCLWEEYQKEQSYRNCCAWLKHRAWMKGEGCE